MASTAFLFQRVDPYYWAFCVCHKYFAVDWAKMMECMQTMLKKVAISILICVAVIISFYYRPINGKCIHSSDTVSDKQYNYQDLQDCKQAPISHA